ncbi:hypothetical protein G3545_14175 [Starkeya sp. ORNL1]|uniref:DUF6161 domain-containing protein n=1 Tax=Starkeya sp. ORNL1 TaxID=2709380 RepID=UPI001462D43A|nr:DUF6161 domain-containing protein [Starkeya sp. ORNL1]QJP14690.1 hypothetical protein G3545_14175 [Starkeya sp. ORNL1]
MDGAAENSIPAIFHNYFAHRHFTATASPIAGEMRTSQRQRLRDLFAIVALERLLTPEVISQFIDQAIAHIANNGQRLTAPCPILVRDLSDAEQAVISERRNEAIGEILIAYCEIFASFGPTSTNAPMLQPLSAAGMAASASRAYISEFRLPGELKRAENEFTSLVSQAYADEKTMLSAAVGEVKDLSKTLSGDIADGKQAHLNWEKIESERSARFNALEAAFATKIVLEKPVETWKKKAAAHRRGFWGASIFMWTASAGVIYLCYRANEAFSDIIRAISATNAIAAAALLAIPLIVAFMAIRIVARSATTNLALREDALQRMALADMYLRLLSDPASTLDNDGKKIAMSALFRAAPGQPIDEPATHPALEVFNSK